MEPRSGWGCALIQRTPYMRIPSPGTKKKEVKRVCAQQAKVKRKFIHENATKLPSTVGPKNTQKYIYPQKNNNKKEARIDGNDKRIGCGLPPYAIASGEMSAWRLFNILQGDNPPPPGSLAVCGRECRKERHDRCWGYGYGGSVFSKWPLKRSTNAAEKGGLPKTYISLLRAA